MGKGTITNKLIEAHLVSGRTLPSSEVSIKIDQTLLQDATGTFVMLELEKLGLDYAKTELSVQYIDHNILQTDHKNNEDQVFLRSACRRYGIHYSGAGNGISHVLHAHHFAIPGKSLLGADSHTCSLGSLGMLAIGSGGLDIAAAMMGEAYYFKMPQILGIELKSSLKKGVNAKDVILELLRRHGVKGALNKVIEYHGPGVASLNVMERFVIASMGAELGATASIFPSDEQTKKFLRYNNRIQDWKELRPDRYVRYDEYDYVDLDTIVPLIAKPSSPGNVVPVSEVVGTPISQAYIGSSANPAYEDFAGAAELLLNNRVAPGVSLDINPSSREILENLMNHGYMSLFINRGGRLHQTGCNGCIGMGQALAPGKNSLRTTPRNFPGRSGVKEDAVWLCSPLTAVASAITGRITDPRTMVSDISKPEIPVDWLVNTTMFEEPLSYQMAQKEMLQKGTNIKSLPDFSAPASSMNLKVILKLNDDVSTDDILPGGNVVLPFRSNINNLANFSFYRLDKYYVKHAKEEAKNGHCIIAGDNYGQGSSREHAAMVLAFLGLKVVVAKSYARIHWQNLISAGVLPLEFRNPDDYDLIKTNNVVDMKAVQWKLLGENFFTISVNGAQIPVFHRLSQRQKNIYLAGGLINYLKKKEKNIRPNKEIYKAYV